MKVFIYRTKQADEEIMNVENVTYTSCNILVVTLTDNRQKKYDRNTFDFFGVHP